MQGIYKIKNKVNGKYYVGSSIDVEKRWYEHRWLLERSDHNSYFQNAWDKYGEENFEFRFVEEVEDEKGLLLIEQEYLDEGFELEILYNIAQRAGGGNLGPEVNQKISESWTLERRKRTVRKIKESWTPERKEEQSKRVSGENNPMYGKDHTEEVKIKLRKLQKEYWTPERKRVQGERISGENNPNYGKDMSGKNNPMYGSHRSGKDNPMYGKVGYWAGKKNPEQSKRMAGEGNPFYGKHHTEETKAGLSRVNAKPYPAFYNEKTEEFIPAGENLLGICNQYNLSQGAMWYVKGGITRQARDGWRLATEEEISNYGCC